VIDHILEHLDLADSYAANADRIAATKNRSKRLLNLIRRCRENSQRESAEAIAHASIFGIDPPAIQQEHVDWRRLRRYPGALPLSPRLISRFTRHPNAANCLGDYALPTGGRGIVVFSIESHTEPRRAMASSSAHRAQPTM
jgi:hypothetical protein